MPCAACCMHTLLLACLRGIQTNVKQNEAEAPATSVNKKFFIFNLIFNFNCYLFAFRFCFYNMFVVVVVVGFCCCLHKVFFIALPRFTMRSYYSVNCFLLLYLLYFIFGYLSHKWYFEYEYDYVFYVWTIFIFIFFVFFFFFFSFFFVGEFPWLSSFFSSNVYCYEFA